MRRHRAKRLSYETLEQRLVLNNAPIAVGDTFGITEGDVLSPPSGLLVNDSDPDSDPLTLIEINGSPLPTSASADIVTAVDDPNEPASFLSLGPANYYGFRFELTEATQIERVGGEFTLFSGNGSFAALVELSGPNDFPDSENLSTPDVLATTQIPVTGSGDAVAEMSIALDPGWYALMQVPVSLDQRDRHP